MASAGERTELDPLVQRNEAGQLYLRSAAVESQIRTALLLSRTELIARSRISERDSPQFLQEECLVYLVRNAYLRNDVDGLNTATEALLRRCMRGIGASFFSLGVAPQDIDDLAADLIQMLITDITSADGRGDFYQVRFRPALRGDLLNVFDRYVRRIRHEQHHVSLSDPAHGDSEAGDHEDGTALQEIISARERVADDVEGRLLIAEALEAIRDQKHREAFVLYHLEGWQVEAKDPADPSISGRFRVTPRTVRTWLRTAESDVAAWYAAKNS
jgi:hypothetical protein